MYVFNDLYYMKNILPYFKKIVNLLFKLNQKFDRDVEKFEKEIKNLNINYIKFKNDIEQRYPKDSFKIYNIWKPRNGDNK